MFESWCSHKINATVCKLDKRPDFQSGSVRRVRVRTPSVVQNGRVTAPVCKTDLSQQIVVVDFSVSEFESHLSHKWSCRLMVRSTPFQGVDAGSIPVRTTKNMGVRQRWRVGLVCKISGFRLSEFESHHSHTGRWLRIESATFSSVDRAAPVRGRVTGSSPVKRSDEKLIRNLTIIVANVVIKSSTTLYGPFV